MVFHRLVFVFLGVFTFRMCFSARHSPTVQKRKAFIMEYFEPCDNKAYSFMLENFSFVRNGTSVFFNGVAVVKRDMRDSILMRFQVDRCKDKSNSDTCVHFTTLKWPDVCITGQIVPLIKDMYEGFSPPMPCPPKKNHYFLKNKKVQMDLVATFLAQGSGSTSLVKVKMHFFEGNRLILCQNAAVRIADVKIRE